MPDADIDLHLHDDDDSSQTPEGETMNEAMEIIKLRLLEANNANHERRTAGADAYAENARMDYLIQKNRVNYSEATAQRIVEESGSGRSRDLGNA